MTLSNFDAEYIKSLSVKLEFACSVFSFKFNQSSFGINVICYEVETSGGVLLIILFNFYRCNLLVMNK